METLLWPTEHRLSAMLADSSVPRYLGQGHILGSSPPTGLNHNYPGRLILLWEVEMVAMMASHSLKSLYPYL